ncbi:MAG: 4-(cytidine 5'-diphospho)-2-C-methyl-D-erythritol kinase [Ferruginibacter sp.]
MVVFPHCKINIGLQVLDKRPDGYHNIKTLFYPLPLKDVLEIIEVPYQQNQISFSSTGLNISTPATKNICVKAYEAFRAVYPDIPKVKMHLHKVIPMGAGLGGGSSDAAFVLKLLNKKFSAGINEEQIIQLAASLGSDCAFFTQNDPCLGEGRGEILTPVKLDLSTYKILLIYSAIQINTADAFKNIHKSENIADLSDVINLPIAEWKDHITNDFEKTIFPLYPQLKILKEKLYNEGALFASMSGSGSSIYGIFNANSNPVFNFPPEYFYKWI